MKFFHGKSNKGFRMEHINRIMILTMVVIGISIIVTAIQVDRRYDMLTDAQNEYIGCYKAASDLQNSSDNLSRCMQYYVQTGEVEFIDAYFDEVDSRRKEAAVSKLSTKILKNAAFIQAMSGYDKLMGINYHIMKLISVATNADISKLPVKVASYSLSIEETNATNEEQLIMARGIIYGKDYAFEKNKIDANITLFSNQILEEKEKSVERLNAEVKSSLRMQKLLIIALIIMFIIIGYIYYTQIIDVLKRYVEHIKEDKPLPEDGSTEMRYLAATYNENRELVEKREKMLKYKANHDDLTGLVTRNAFEGFVEKRLSEVKDTYGMLVLIDVDNFKDINDNYGHDIGDFILRNLSNMLKNIAGETGLAGRIGGDEFVVWLELVERSSSYIEEKINHINKALLIPMKRIPASSITAGCTYQIENDCFQTMYKDADIALYKAKDAGKCKCYASDREISKKRTEKVVMMK